MASEPNEAPSGNEQHTGDLIDEEVREAVQEMRRALVDLDEAVDTDYDNHTVTCVEGVVGSCKLLTELLSRRFAPFTSGLTDPDGKVYFGKAEQQ